MSAPPARAIDRVGELVLNVGEAMKAEEVLEAGEITVVAHRVRALRNFSSYVSHVGRLRTVSSKHEC